jgi:hypothetical protein
VFSYETLQSSVISGVSRGAFRRKTCLTPPNCFLSAAKSCPCVDSFRTMCLQSKPEKRTKVTFLVEKIISGGQTGVDRAALDIALELGIPCGGWCPKGRKSEDGPIPNRYPLQETGSTSYPVRTAKNVQDSDGTLVLTMGPPMGGTALTIKLAKEKRKPFLVFDLKKKGDPLLLRSWILTNQIKILNIAGPRESECPDVYRQASEFLHALFET